ncbi:hypothetical protein BJX68DRAFT_279544 [Aspergillus pseudodeflectus]|uniref:Nephrocystin 3-like N-terminal domain-containing protein n=1 Tax=Aspergillus pseudodeflectus TaxID=176178 RepID=A0ABR4KUX4_9EURO
MTEPPQALTHGDYTVGWVCALPDTELVAAMAMLDETHPVLPAADPHDSNSYVLGRIGDHNVVVACLPVEITGKVSAATVAKDMVRSFPAVRFGLMVGIGGGAPYYGEDSEDTEESDDDLEDIRDIRLGDVVISLHSKSSDAVVQYDFGKSLQEREFILSGGKLNKPPSIVLSAVAHLKAQHRLEGHNNISKTLETIMSTRPTLAKEFQCPGSQKDYLFKSEIACRSLNSSLVKRDHRPNGSPRLHYGTIGLADQVMKDALLRDKWAREKSIICFEMEAAGLMDSFPCLVIRGICDYADSHKNKIWQPYAAATAACYAKELLHVISGQGVMNMDPVKQIEKSVKEVHSIVKDLSRGTRQRKVFEKLLYAEGSSFDASDAEHEARCHPETRLNLLYQIIEWANSPSQECIFWLNGMAGTGKSTISRTIAQHFREKNQLGASFFFKRGEGERANAKRFFTTICAQLLLQVPALIYHVEVAIDADPYISGKSMKEQFTKLLLEPLLSLDQNEPTIIVIVIDALDECGNADDIRTILQLLPAVQKCKSRQIRIFVTSRPELPIRSVFERSNKHQSLVLHELSNTEIEKDIRVFLRDEFSRMRVNRQISSEWPGDDVLETLVRRAVPLFISAATACRFIEEGRHPERRLKKLLEAQAVTSGSQMDKIYQPVLTQLLTDNEDESNEILQEFRDIVGGIITLAAPLSVQSLTRLLDLPTQTISDILDPLHSVLNISRDFGTPVRILHLSFQEYLLKTESNFHVDEQEMHSKIGLHCLRVMNGRLKHNNCGLSSYGTQKLDICSQSIDQHLSADLQYSCQYWIYHVQQSKGLISEPQVFPFLERHFLHWLEALSLMGIISEAVGMIDMLQGTISKGTARIASFLYDAKRFILKNTYIARLAPLQLYSSGLAFSPMESTIRKMFSNSIPKYIRAPPQVEEYWSPGQQTLEGHSDTVWSVAFSHDSQMMVASGSYDSTIKLWDVKTGSELQALKGHSRLAPSVASTMRARKHHDNISHNLEFHVSVSDNWVMLAGENILWLPPEHRRFTASAVTDATLALGYSDGRVSIIGFYMP